MTRLIGALFVILAFAGAVSAHPMTLKGTVAAVEPERIQVRTGEEKKGETPAWVLITKKTKILRGKTALTLEAAKITVGERIVVDVDHEPSGMKATQIRLADRAAK